MPAYIPFDVRFWAKVDKSGGPGACWTWTGATTAGYGIIQASRSRKLLCAHIASYEMAKGPVSKGLLVLHLCDNPQCVNPLHLVTGTQLENMAQARARGRTGYGGIKRKLTAEQYDEILALRGTMTTYQIAKKFNVVAQTITRIFSGKSKRPGSENVARKAALARWYPNT